MKLGSETETIEYKKSTSELREGIISVVAILNKHNGGELYFGIRNDGVAVGQDISDKTLRDISQVVANHIEPQIYPDIRNVVIDNKNCIHITFEGDNVPYYAYGRAYLRVADEDRVMSPQELESYILKKNANTTVWDSEASNKTVDDVNERILMDYIAKANAAGRIDYGYTNKYDILKRLKLLSGDSVNNTAKVMFCDNANLEVQMATFATNERLTFLDIDRKSGTINELVDIAENYIKKNIRWRVEFDGGLQRKEIPEIPIEAIREALFNSFCHKNYRVSQNNYVCVFKDFIEIYNPGTFPEGLNPQDFINGSEQSVHRNPLLAQILYYSKDIESFGTGLRRISKACQEADVKVEFQKLKLGFNVVFHRFDKEVDFLGRVVTDNPPDIPDKVPDIPDINSREAIVIDYLKINAFITNKKVCELLSISTEAAKKFLQLMVKKGLIIAEGENRGRRYKL
ncbi:MAG: putative DNA binding domain-containing protein [Oscillospiraceae bacterium]|nr:putative DNA binding domain-containing protein [Oscillospiraceae bacterium]